MPDKHPAEVSGKLLSRFIHESNDYHKMCLHLQEIIALGRTDDVWRRALTAFFDNPPAGVSDEDFCRN